MKTVARHFEHGDEILSLPAEYVCRRIHPVQQELTNV